MAAVTIVGAGMMGSALAFPARENGHDVRLVGTHLDGDIIEYVRAHNRHIKFERDFPTGVKYFFINELKEALEGADLVIGGVSSFGVDWFGSEILPLILDTTPILTVTKGLMDTQDGKLLTYPQIWEERALAAGRRPLLNAVGGPCTSYELVAHDQTEVWFCGKDMDVLRKIRDIMQTDYYHISITQDVTGIESAVALKNGYALGIALTIGLNQKEYGIDSPLHFNSQAAVFAQSVREMSRLLQLQGSFSYENIACGAGDLYVTVYGGRTRLAGILLGRGLDIDETKRELSGVTLESLVVAERVGRAVRRRIEAGELSEKDFPLLLHVDDIITKKARVSMPWENFTYENGRIK